MACLGCGRGFHDECEIGCKSCHPDIDQLFKATVSIGGRGAPIKEPEDVKDRHSTGRKRAALLYPIVKENPCEWRGKKNCGGGTPIVGCINGFQRHRHHGPVKDTLRNEAGNVHRICNHCHNRWHAVNDPVYDAALYEDKPHNPELATELELMENEMYWSTK